ncbi:hypothetical protein WAI453_008609 [Rhynchosporium graminicola]
MKQLRYLEDGFDGGCSVGSINVRFRWLTTWTTLKYGPDHIFMIRGRSDPLLLGDLGRMRDGSMETRKGSCYLSWTWAR